MKVRPGFLLLILPIILWLAWMAFAAYQRGAIDDRTYAPSGLVWDSGGTELKAEVTELVEGEAQHFRLSIKRADGGYVFEKELIIDWDMGGGGFLLAMQADEDPELEIVFMSRNRQAAQVFDIVAGEVNERNYDAMTPLARQLSQDWLSYHAPHPVAIGLAALLTLVYYFLYFFVFLVRRWIRRKRNMEPSR